MSLIKFKPKSQNVKVRDPFYELLNWEHPYFGLTGFPSLSDSLGDLKEAFTPAIDVSEDKSNIYVKADLPGLKKEDIDIDVENNQLRIRGERKHEEEKKEENYYRVERSYGSFQRILQLDSNVDQTKIKANYQDGVLKLVLPKAAQAVGQKIQIDS